MQEIKVEVLSFFTLKFDLTHEDWGDMTQADKWAFIRNQARFNLEANSEEIIDKSSITWK
jgi:hypothetical protein